MFFGAGLIIVGAIWLLGNLGYIPVKISEVLIPVILILWGISILAQSKKR